MPLCGTKQNIVSLHKARIVAFLQNLRMVVCIKLHLTPIFMPNRTNPTVVLRYTNKRCKFRIPIQPF